MRTNINRRSFITLVSASVPVGLMAACSTPAPAPTTAPAAAATTAPAPAAAAASAVPAAASGTTVAAAAKPAWTITDKPITVSMWDSTEDTKQKLFNEQLIPEYKKLRPNVTIKYEAQSTNDLLQKLLAVTAVGTAPDIFELNDTFLPTYFARNVLEPLPPQAFGYNTLDEMLKKYVPGRLDAMTYQGKLYGVPDQMNSTSLFMNNRLFKEAGLDPTKDAPKTWEELLALNPKFVKYDASGKIIQKGFDIRATNATAFGGMFISLLPQFGGVAIDEKGKAVFNNDLGVQAMTLTKRLAFAPRVTKNTGASPYTDFAEEQDAMTTMGPNGGIYAELISPKIKGNYTVAQFPQVNPAKPVTTFTSFDVFVNSKASEDVKRVAWDFIAFALTKPDLWFEKTGMLQPMLGWENTAGAKAIPYLDIHQKDMALAQPRPRTQFWNEFNQALGRAGERVVYENQDPKTALDIAAKEYDAAAAG